MRRSWPSSMISATVLSFAHSATAAKMRGMLACQVGMSRVRFSSARSGRSIITNSSSFGTMRIT